MAQFINLTFFSSLPHVAAASLMCIEMIGCAGVMVGGVLAENGRSAARDGDFSIVDAVVDVGGGCDEEGVILTPQPSPPVAMEAGRMLLKFDGD